MFYDALRNDHGLPHDPFKALVAPRPIGWISSLDPAGNANLAPYSFFNAVADRPAYVVFGSAGRKDSLSNIEATGEFVCNLATWDLRQEMNASSAAVSHLTDEFELAGVSKAACRMVRAPRVAESPVALECRFEKTVELPGHDVGAGGYALIIGKVVGVHIDDAFIVDGIVNTTAMKPIARMGYAEYAVVTEAFRMSRPG